MKLNRATLRTVEILKLVSKEPDGIALDEVCVELDMPKTSAYSVVTTLIQTGMIHVARKQKQRYIIGLTAYRIRTNYTNNLGFVSTIDPVLKAFPKEVGGTVFFRIRPDGSIVYIYKFEPEDPIVTTATVGMKNLIYYTSLDEVIMAYTEDEDRDDILSRISFKKHTDRTIYTREEFERKPESVWEKGCTSDARELEEHMECVEAPMFEQDGNVVGAISVSNLCKSAEDYNAPGHLINGNGAQLSHLLRYTRHV